jgi:hypothetical protein
MRRALHLTQADCTTALSQYSCKPQSLNSKRCQATDRSESAPRIACSGHESQPRCFRCEQLLCRAHGRCCSISLPASDSAAVRDPCTLGPAPTFVTSPREVGTAAAYEGQSGRTQAMARCACLPGSIPRGNFPPQHTCDRLASSISCMRVCCSCSSVRV